MKSKMKYSIVFLLALLMGILWYGSSQSSEKGGKNTAVDAFVLASDDHIKGNPEGSIIIIEYLDFECPACAAYAPVIHALRAEFSDDVRIVARYFPLSMHKNGFSSARAVEAAARQGKYWEMYDILLSHQKEWGGKTREDQALFEKYAVAIGLDVEKFKNDVFDPVLAERIKRDIISGEQLGIRGTPSFFLNGKEIHPRTIEELRGLIISKKNKTL
jgi:protein-disulfide isomerase